MELFDRPGTGERALIVHLSINESFSEDDLSEFEQLVISANVEPLATVTGSRRSPDARFFVGKGKLDEVKHQLHETCADIVLFNHTLSPSQQRNLEKELEVRVLDRTNLILDIFAQRAQSFEGKLQVELAQLQHLSTRLIRGWTHLERQKGGIGLRGPGETQLETDRRLIGQRIRQIKTRLTKVNKQRDQGRRSRQRADVPTVSLVGYTNAGKSTLLNALTNSAIYAADQLFATLDPTLRQVKLPDYGELVLADTVGFIQNLPHELVAAFRSTLQETIEADLLLHVVDASSPNRQEQIHEVNSVLKEIGADNIPQVMVYNKIDCLPAVDAHVDKDETDSVNAVWLSAMDGDGINLLLETLSTLCHDENTRMSVVLKPEQAKLRAKLFQVAQILKEENRDDGCWVIELNISNKYKHLLTTI
ncbi:ribosome rescue GTPase HflX [Cycloclasticus pugetii]|uniref:ribosome rescue GTPase HflX n=1 Tax=Cycloclasticus pugetii TaxID=34068 RepID=UPI000915005C|nr:ribosome rescue GTPase HflX [Cycloclasticus pugetii]SHI47673.1 GTP-binding protein HflX [Cycloclasticus pugetii]